MALTSAQRAEYRDRRDVLRRPAGGGVYEPVSGEQDIPCKFITKARFDERVGVAGVASIDSRRFSQSLHEEVGRDTRAGDVVRVRQYGGPENEFVVKGEPERHPSIGSRIMNYQAYDLSATPDPTQEAVAGADDADSEVP